MDLSSEMEKLSFNSDTKESFSNTRVQQLKTIQSEAAELFRKKNTDYGDAFASSGAIGVIIRLGDKIQRLLSITNNKISLTNENIKDTLIDLHNYAAMAIMLLEENKSLVSPQSLMSPISKEWTIQGTRGNTYKRQIITMSNGHIVNTCSCPSYIYSPNEHKTCKHI